jgi:ribonuclease E
MPAAEPMSTVPTAPAAAALTPVMAPVFEPPREAPMAAAPAAPERAREARTPASPPQIDLDSALRESGLVMIETSRDKAQAAAPAMEEVQAPRVRRERRPPPPDLDTPLQQVETTHKSDSESQPPR